MEQTPAYNVMDTNGRDPATGKFVKGYAGGPGRPKGSTTVDFRATCRRFAKENGLDVEALIWSVAKGMFLKAARGDATAGKLILDRWCGILEKGPEVNVGVGVGVEVTANNQEQVLPPRRELAVQLLEIKETATKLLSSEDELDALLE